MTWVVGWFNETLPAFLRANPRRNVSYLHIDSDIYSSASTALTLLAPRLSVGAVLVFDELINYPEFEQHEMRALMEFQAATGRTVRVLGTSAAVIARSRAEYFRLTGRHGSEAALKKRGYKQDAALQLL